ncbi:MAG TPA: M20/M25/M40 family metallo-hydrolase [Verrucomicrobiota bacterium]|nr:hypothetical protein [Verrucomicrobiales bacterium]HRI15030.1 M20/M25/M40 family metallo-hydrolase [Verrucomicrobiota bacterium]
MLRASLMGLWLGLSLAAQDWQPLFDGKSLKGWTKAEFGGSGAVEVEDGAIVLNQGLLTGVNYTNPSPRIDYEVELEARRVVGSDFFCGFTFPVNDTFATLIVGGWGGSVIGISSLDGNDAAHNETTQHRRFEAGRWYRIRVKVTAENLSVWIDDDSVINVDIREKKISLRPGDIELSKPFGFASYSTTAELRNIRRRQLDSKKPATPAPAKPGAALPAELRERLAQLVSAATNSSVGYSRLVQLCDTFGSRPSGSTNLESAIDWILTQLRTDGFSEVRGEPVMVPHWVRGDEACEVQVPRSQRLSILGLGGSVATPAQGIAAPVLVVTNFAELTQRSDEARGRIVVFNQSFSNYGETVRYRKEGAIEAARVGAVASLIRSVTPFSLRTPHTGMMNYDRSLPKLPHAALAPEDVELLARWQAAGVTPVLWLKLSGRNAPEALSRNIVADWSGRETPEQIVVVGGHIDSWDVGQGAQDDAGGCIAAWEAVRLMKQLQLRPRRTVRLVMWTNEESGLAGAKAYRETHREELGRHIAGIESDNGTFPPAGFGFTGSDAGGEIIRGILGFLGETLDAGAFTLGGQDADLTPLIAGGVPALGLRMKPNNYLWVHHSEADTVDKVAPADLGRCTAALAVMAFALADWETPLPR